MEEGNSSTPDANISDEWGTSEKRFDLREEEWIESTVR